jgi:hypothetical protein
MTAKEGGMADDRNLAAIQHNERIKAWSGALSNAGLALLAGTVVIIYSGRATDEIFFWAFVGIVAVLLAGGMMNLLRLEE